MKIREAMTPEVHCITPHTTLLEAAALMRQLDVGALVVQEDQRVVGLVTDRDVVLRAFADGKDPSTTPVREAMELGAPLVHDDEPLEQARDVMDNRRVARLPVLDREDRLVGIISAEQTRAHLS